MESAKHSRPRPRTSRLDKEMYGLRLKNNPFSSPPSSTGSHDTVTTTSDELTNDSAFSSSPDGEGTRRFSSSSQNKSRARRSVINTSVLARTFPEWSGLAHNPTFTKSITTGSLADVRAPQSQDKAVHLPLSPVADTSQDENSYFDNKLDAERSSKRATMQARVDNESDCSTVLSRAPLQPADAPQPRHHARLNRNEASPGPPGTPKATIQDIISKIRVTRQQSADENPPLKSPPKEPKRPVSHMASPAVNRSTLEGRSFFLPPFRYLPDWTSGTLKFSTMRNGVPVFVKSGGKHAEEHGVVQGVEVPGEDAEILVSLDKLQDEVRELHDHDAMLQEEAEKLQVEVAQLQSELKRFKVRKLSDSAIGSDSDSSENRRLEAANHRLEEQIGQLEKRLAESTRQAGVHELHSATLTAERDEALRDLSAAREKAMKLQAQLASAHKDDETSDRLRHEKEILALEITSLRAGNDALRQQSKAVVESHKVLQIEHEKLRRDYSSMQHELVAVRQELAALRKNYDALLKEKKTIFSDHASMECNKDTYLAENKKLRAQVVTRDQHIADLKKGINNRDEMIDAMQNYTTDSAIHEQNVEMESEIEQLRQQIEQQRSELREKEAFIKAKDSRIRVLVEQNLELAEDNRDLREKSRKLTGEHKEMRGQWMEDRHKVAQLSQLLAKNKTEYLRTMNDNTEDCVRLEERFKQKEAEFVEKLERRDDAVKMVRALAKMITELQKDMTATLKPTKKDKTTRNVPPSQSSMAGATRTSDATARSSARVADDDPETEFNLTQGSEYASFMSDEIQKLRQVVQELSKAKEGRDEETSQTGDYSLPRLAVERDDGGTLPKQTTASLQQPAGILKKKTSFGQMPLEVEDTGRFSIKSALSFASHHTEEFTRDATGHSHKSTRSMSESAGQNRAHLRPDSRLQRRFSAVDGEDDVKSTSILPDITVHPDPSAGEKKMGAALSKEARRVLDGVCKHKADNCNICTRISLYAERHTEQHKKTIHVTKPVPVSDRMPADGTYVEEPTLRPSMPPGNALAILIKETRDEMAHLEMQLRRQQERYFAHDKSLGQREHRRLMLDIQRLQRELEVKRGHMYKLHDVLEGQRLAGQLMEVDAIDVTLLSGVDGEKNGTVESVWEGFD